MHNELYGTSDDGVDADGSSVLAEWNIIHDCGDQAFSLVGMGTSRVSHNLCYRNGNGLSVKDSHVCFAEFNTLTLNTVTGARAIEKTPGRGGGSITLRSSIVWGNVVQLLIESTGAIDAAYCDVEGGAVPGAGNLSLDPMFGDPLINAFFLRPGSPCIGAAEDGSDLGAIPFETSPSPPSDLQATVQGVDAVRLHWRDNSAIEKSFELERAVGDGAFSVIAELPPETVEHVDGGLAAGTTYRYRLRALGDEGASPWSDAVTAVTETLQQPGIAGIEPASGSALGGTRVTIRGDHFQGAVTARLAGVALTDVQVISAEEIHGVTPQGARGPADLVVSAAGGEAVLPGAFRYFDAYRRGDANGDGSMSITDVLVILEYLFRSGTPPPCPDVADANGDSDVDLADAVSLLFHLFAGGRAPAPAEAKCFQ
jgi:hypothetical protein